MKTTAALLNGLIEKLGYTISRFEKEIGVSPSRLDKAIRRDSKLNFDIVHKILERFPEVNKDWLITGQGDMLTEPQTPAKGEKMLTGLSKNEAADMMQGLLIKDMLMRIERLEKEVFQSKH